MKKILLCLLISSTPLLGSAQSKQVKVLLQQIAALKVYIGYAQKGYSIYRKGLTAIGDLKQGEFDLHSDYYTSLKIVNPKVRSYARVAEILALQEDLMDHYNTAIRQLDADALFYGDEKAYIKRVYGRLLDDCDRILEDLTAVTTDNQLEMKDNERITRIDALYNSMKENYTFCGHFSGQVRVLSLSRAKAATDVQTVRALHGIKTD